MSYVEKIKNGTYVIAEMSANHAGDKERALEIIHAAKEAGADCIKIQTYTPDTMTIDSDKKYFQITDGTWKGDNFYHLYQKAYTPWEWQGEMKEEADKIGLDFLSTPFDKTSVDFLESLGVDSYKIASFECTDLPLVSYVASKGKPMIISTGMATYEEMKELSETIKSKGNIPYALLRCCSDYPAITDCMNLRTMVDMGEKFQVPVGLSDHSMEDVAVISAVAMGAKIIEKHFCLSRKIENPDASFSLEPKEFGKMVELIRKTESAMGSIAYGPSKREMKSLHYRRSIFCVKDIEAGERISEENVRIIRPSDGLEPKYWEQVIGKKAKQKIERGTPLNWEMLGE